MNNIAKFFRESMIARFLIPLGLVLIVFGIIMFIVNIKNQNYLEITSTVTNAVKTSDSYTDVDGEYVEEKYEVTIKYNVDNHEYENKLEDMPKYDIGDKIKIYYNPNDPSQITQTKSLTIPMVMIASGVVSITCGIISIINAIKKHKLLKEQEKGWENGK